MGAITIECNDQNEIPRKIPTIPPTSDIKLNAVYLGRSVIVGTLSFESLHNISSQEFSNFQPIWQAWIYLLIRGKLGME